MFFWTTSQSLGWMCLIFLHTSTIHKFDYTLTSLAYQYNTQYSIVYMNFICDDFFPPDNSIRFTYPSQVGGEFPIIRYMCYNC